MPSSSIVAANKEVKCLVDVKAEESHSKRGQYTKYSDEERAKVAKRASEMGVTNSMRFFKKEFHDCPLKESTVHTWKNKYEQELKL
jgi:hypothetical protein